MSFTAYGNGGFDMLSRGLGMLGQDVQSYQKQQKLADLGQQLQSGNYEAAAQAAIAGGDLASGLKLIELGKQQSDDPYFKNLFTPQASGSTGGTATAAAPAQPGNTTYTGGLLPAQLSGGVDPNNMDPASPVIGSMENAGKGYAAVGKPTSDGDQAYGIHQVMGKNVGPWTQEVLGKEMTPQEFLANPFAQERVFAVKFNQYRQKYGNDQTAAQAWFAGPGGVGTNRSDGNATVPEYAAEFAARNQTAPQVLGEDAAAPTQVASADNSFAPTGSGAVAADSADKSSERARLTQDRDNYIIALARAKGTRWEAPINKKIDTLNQQIKDLKEADASPLTDPAERAKWGIPSSDTRPYFLKNGVPQQLGRGTASDGPRVVSAGAVLVGADGKPVFDNRNANPSLDAETVDSLAKRVADGDTSALVGLGRGRQGAENIGAIQKRVAEIAAGLPQQERTILQNRADQAGRMAGARTSNTINARVDVFANEANSAMDLALETSRNLPRTTYTTFNKMLQAGQTETNDPALAAHQAQINAVANTYAKAINGGGIGTVSDKEHARSVLNAAQSPEAFEATIRQLKREVGVAHQSARSAAALRDQPVTGGEAEPAPSVPPPGSTSQTIGGAISGFFSPKPTAQQAPPQAIQVPPAAAAAAQQYKGAPGGLAAAVKDAQTAIANGAPRAAVIQRLQSLGFDPAALGQ